MSTHKNGDDKPKRLEIMQPLFILAPFVGYLAAYLIRLGKAGYLRIPTEYVSVGLEDALVSGSVLIVLSITAVAFYEYLSSYAAWKWVRQKGKLPPFRMVNRFEEWAPIGSKSPDSSSTAPGHDAESALDRMGNGAESALDRMGNGAESLLNRAEVDAAFSGGDAAYAEAYMLTRSEDVRLHSKSRFVLSRIAFMVVTLIAAAALGATVVFTIYGLVCSLVTSGKNLGGRDLWFVGFLAFGLLCLFSSSLYLYQTKTGQLVKERVVPGGFGNIKYKHVTVGMTVVIFLGGACFFSGFTLAGWQQDQLVDPVRKVLILDISASGKAVAAEYEEVEGEAAGEAAVGGADAGAGAVGGAGEAAVGGAGAGVDAGSAGETGPVAAAAIKGTARSAATIRLTGRYWFYSLPEGLPDESDPSFEWKRCSVLPPVSS